MSKQSEAKERQGYVRKVIPRVCSNCAHFKMETVAKSSPWGHEWTEDKNLRCLLGGFAVKKMASCNEWTKA